MPLLSPGSLEPGRDHSGLRHATSAERIGNGVPVVQGRQGLMGLTGPSF